MAFLKAIKPFFPFSYREKTGKDLALSIIIYVIINIVASVVLIVAALLVGLFADFGVIFWLLTSVLGLAGTVIGIYVVAGIAMSILHFTGVLDKANKSADDKKDAE